jgi:hypothetical protein
MASRVKLRVSADSDLEHRFGGANKARQQQRQHA